MKGLIRIVFFVCLASIALTSYGQTYTSTGTGNWSTATTWTPNIAGGPTSANSTAIIIAAGHNVTTDINVTIDQTTIQGTGTITVGGGTALTIADGTGTDLQNNGTLAIASQPIPPPPSFGLVTVNGSLNNAGTITGASGTTLVFNNGSQYDHQLNGSTIPTASWATTSTCLVSGVTNSIPAGIGQNFGNFTWNCGSQSGFINFGGALSSVANDLSFLATNGQATYLTSVTTYTLTVGRDLIIQNSYVGFNSTATTATLNIVRDFSASSNSSLDFTFSGNDVIDVNGAFSIAGGTTNFTYGGSANISINVAGDFTLSSSPTINNSGSGTYDLIFDGTAVQNFSADVGFPDFDVTVNNFAHLDIGTSAIRNVNNENFTLIGGGSLYVGSTDASGAMQTGTTAGNIRVGGTRTYNATGNIIYNGSGAQVIGNGFPTTAVNLEINNVAGVTNSAGASNIIGNLTLTNGSFNIGASSSMSIQSNLSRTSGTIGGSATSNLTFSGSGVTLDPIAMTSGAATLNNLTISGSENISLASDLTVVGVLDNDNTLDFSNRTLTLNGTFTGFGDFIANSSSEMVIGGSGAFGTIGFSGAGNQLNNLTINRTSGTVTWAASVTIINGLYLTKGTLVHSSGLTMAATTGTVYKGQGEISTNEPIAASGYDLVFNSSGNTSLESTSATKINNVTLTTGTIVLQNNFTVNGDFDLDNGTFNAGTNNVTMAGSGVDFLADGGSFSQSALNSLIASGTVTLAGTSIDGTQIGNLEITGTLTAPSANIFVSGDFDNDGTFNASTGTITFNGTGSVIQGTSTTTFHNLAISASGVLTASSGTSNISGSYTNSGTFNNGGGTIVMNSSSTESITCGGDPFNNLTFSGSGTVTLADALDVNGDLTLISGSSLDVTTNDRDINIAGDWLNNGGTFNRRDGEVIFDGTIMDIGGSAATTFNDISLTNGTTRVTGTADLEGTMTLSASTTFDADGPSNTGVFTVKSLSGGDARIATLGAGAVINGNLTFERYLPSYGSKRWRNIGSAVASARVSDMQNEIMISGDFTGNNNIALGLTDPLGPNSIQSLAGYDESLNNGVNDDWVNFPVSANTETFAVGRGYSIYVRETGAVTFDLRGTVNQGNLSLPVSGTGDLWNLVSNPYPSSIDWDAGTGWTRSNIQGDAIAVWNGLQYLTWNGSTGSLGNGRVPMGMAFWVQASNSSISLDINENAKTATQGTVHRELTPTAIELALTGVNYVYTDKTHIAFNEESTEAFDQNDFGKLPNAIFNLSTQSSDGEELSINSISNFVCGEEIPINITNLWVDSYEMEWSGLSTIDSDVDLYIRDNTTGAVHDLRSETSFVITVTTENDHYDTLGTESEPVYTYQIKDRFDLIVQEREFSSSLQVNAEQLCEVEQSGQITIVDAEDGVLYQVYSDNTIIADGLGTDSDLIIPVSGEILQVGDNNFTIVASRGSCNFTEFDNPVTINIINTPDIAFNEDMSTLSTSATGNLQWYEDDLPLEGQTGASLEVNELFSGEHTYKVMAYNDGCEKYSEEFLITGFEEELNNAGIEVYPNPVSDKININLEKSAISDVFLRILSSSGKVVYQRDRFTGSVEIDASAFESGIYLVEITDASNRYVTRVVKQ